MPDNNRTRELVREWLELNRITGNDEPLPEELQEVTEEANDVDGREEPWREMSEVSDERIQNIYIQELERLATWRIGTTVVNGSTPRGVRFSDSPNKLSVDKISDKEQLVKCIESNKEYPRSECVYSNYHGVFLHKDSESYIKDYILEGDIIITNHNLVNTEARRLYNVFTELKDGVFSGGGLTGYPDSNDNQVLVYVINPERYDSYGLDVSRFKIPKLYITHDMFFVDIKLLDNDEFKESFIENYEDGTFYLKLDINPKDKRFTEKKMLKRGYRKGNFFKKLLNHNKPNTFVKTLNKKYTFGLEVETISGYLPAYTTRNVSFQAVHDGSLRDPETDHTYGGEYVTDILKGDLGLLQAKRLMNAIADRCLINKQCSVHLHLGGINFSKENVILMYYMFKQLESQIFSMFPHSRRTNEYCRILPDINIDITSIIPNMVDNTTRKYMIDEYYDKIIKILSSIEEGCSSSVNKRNNHPKGSKCGYDHSTARYCWVNLIPSVFNIRSNGAYTVEFRIHSATKSYTKVKNWLLICMGLMDYIENYKLEFYKNHKHLDIYDIMKTVYGNKSEFICEYITKRIIKFEVETDPDLGDDIEEVIIDNDLSIKNL